MKRVVLISRNVVVGCIGWAAALQFFLPSVGHLAVLLAPLLLLISFGLYLLILLVYGACTFRSYPEEAKALHADIAQAKEALEAQGYTLRKASTRND